MSIQEAQGQDTSWAKRDDSGKEVVTNLQFYFHDTLSGNNPSAIPVVKPARTNTTSFTGFGSLTMVDDPLTTGPESTSKEVGRARGLYGSAGQNDFGLIMVMSYVFTDGIYDGSSFSLLSINPATNPVREMAIVGGTGLFSPSVKNYKKPRTLFSLKRFRSNKNSNEMNDIKAEFKEEAGVIEQCLKINGASRKEFPSFNSLTKEIPVFNPSDYLAHGYPYYRSRNYTKADSYWSLQRGNCDYPIFESKSDKPLILESVCLG
ncbi:hypothetical protein ACET3Z_021045 [Daucus carota]